MDDAGEGRVVFVVHWSGERHAVALIFVPVVAFCNVHNTHSFFHLFLLLVHNAWFLVCGSLFT